MFFLCLVFCPIRFVIRRDTIYFRTQFISWLCHYRALSDELYAITNYRVFLYRKTCVLYILVVVNTNLRSCIFYFYFIFFLCLLLVLFFSFFCTNFSLSSFSLLLLLFVFLPVALVLRDKFRPCVENEWFDINLKRLYCVDYNDCVWLCVPF